MVDGGFDYMRYGAMRMDRIQVMNIGSASQFTLSRKRQPKVVKSEVE